MSGGDVGERGKAWKAIAKNARLGEAMRWIVEALEQKYQLVLRSLGWGSASRQEVSVEW